MMVMTFEKTIFERYHQHYEDNHSYFEYGYEMTLTRLRSDQKWVVTKTLSYEMTINRLSLLGFTFFGSFCFFSVVKPRTLRVSSLYGSLYFVIWSYTFSDFSCKMGLFGKDSGKSPKDQVHISSFLLAVRKLVSSSTQKCVFEVEKCVLVNESLSQCYPLLVGFRRLTLYSSD